MGFDYNYSCFGGEFISYHYFFILPFDFESHGDSPGLCFMICEKRDSMRAVMFETVICRTLGHLGGNQKLLGEQMCTRGSQRAGITDPMSARVYLLYTFDFWILLKKEFHATGGKREGQPVCMASATLWFVPFDFVLWSTYLNR